MKRTSRKSIKRNKSSKHKKLGRGYDDTRLNELLTQITLFQDPRAYSQDCSDPKTLSDSQKTWWREQHPKCTTTTDDDCFQLLKETTAAVRESLAELMKNKVSRQAVSSSNGDSFSQSQDFWRSTRLIIETSSTKEEALRNWESRYLKVLPEPFRFDPSVLESEIIAKLQTVKDNCPNISVVDEDRRTGTSNGGTTGYFQSQRSSPLQQKIELFRSSLETFIEDFPPTPVCCDT